MQRFHFIDETMELNSQTDFVTMYKSKKWKINEKQLKYLQMFCSTLRDIVQSEILMRTFISCNPCARNLTLQMG